MIKNTSQITTWLAGQEKNSTIGMTWVLVLCICLCCSLAFGQATVKNGELHAPADSFVVEFPDSFTYFEGFRNGIRFRHYQGKKGEEVFMVMTFTAEGRAFTDADYQKVCRTFNQDLPALETFNASRSTHWAWGFKTRTYHWRTPERDEWLDRMDLLNNQRLVVLLRSRPEQRFSLLEGEWFYTLRFEGVKPDPQWHADRPYGVEIPGFTGEGWPYFTPLPKHVKITSEVTWDRTKGSRPDTANERYLIMHVELDTAEVSTPEARENVLSAFTDMIYGSDSTRKYTRLVKQDTVVFDGIEGLRSEFHFTYLLRKSYTVVVLLRENEVYQLIVERFGDQLNPETEAFLNSFYAKEAPAKQTSTIPESSAKMIITVTKVSAKVTKSNSESKR